MEITGFAKMCICVAGDVCGDMNIPFDHFDGKRERTYVEQEVR